MIYKTDQFNVMVLRGASLLCNEPVVMFQPKINLFGNNIELEKIKRCLIKLFPFACYGMNESALKSAFDGNRALLLLLVFAKNILNRDRGAIKFFGLIGSDGNNFYGQYSFYIGYHDPVLTINAIEFASSLFQWIESLILCESDELLDDLDYGRMPSKLQISYSKIKNACFTIHPDFQAKILIEGARKLGIPFKKVSDYSMPKIWRYGTCSRHEDYFESMRWNEGSNSISLLNNKNRFSKFVAYHGFCSPNHVCIQSKQHLADLWNQFDRKVVVKPLSSAKGNGVCVLPGDFDVLNNAFESAKKYSNQILIEEFIPGFDYRLLVVDGILVSAIKRVPPYVVGDGNSPIKLLVDRLNAKLDHDPWTRDIRVRIDINDYEVQRSLDESTLTTSSILSMGKVFFLRKNSNVSTGGHCEDVTSEIHIDNRKMVEHLGSQLGLHSVGFDFISPDISESWKKIKSSIIEANQCPGLFLHCTSSVDTQQEIGSKLLWNARNPVPAVLVIGSSFFIDLIIAHISDRQRERSLSHIAVLTEKTVSIDGNPRVAFADAHQGFEYINGVRRCGGVIVLLTPEYSYKNGLPLDMYELGVIDVSIKSQLVSYSHQLSLKYAKITTLVGQPSSDEIEDCANDLIDIFLHCDPVV